MKAMEGNIMKWWEYVILAVVFYAGWMVSAYSLIVPSICVNFGIPFSKRIQRESGVDTTNIIKANRMTVLFWLIIDTIALVLLIFIVPRQYALAYAAGCVVCLLFGIGKTRQSPSNIADYINSYRKLISESDLEAFDNYMSQFQ